MARILITGSRAWTDSARIRGALLRAGRNFEGEEIVLVSGACPNGADILCEEISGSLGWTIERHPADWNLHGRKAGYVRNAEMVSLGADMCLAFIMNNSRGASMTAKLADKAGIQTRIYRMEEADG